MNFFAHACLLLFTRDILATFERGRATVPTQSSTTWYPYGSAATYSTRAPSVIAWGSPRCQPYSPRRI